VKEAAFSGVFATVEALTKQGASVQVHDPLFSDEELLRLGLTPYHYGEETDLAIVQADHAEYRTVAPEQLPGVRLLVDGRRVTDPALWVGVPRTVVGQGVTS